MIKLFAVVLGIFFILGLLGVPWWGGILVAIFLGIATTEYESRNKHANR